MVTKGVVFGACVALVIACSAKPKMASSPATMAPASTDGSGVPGGMAPREEIQSLDRDIEAALTGMGLRPAPPAPCAANQSCGQVAPMPMAIKPASEDPTCKVGASDTCKDSCNLSDSICKNADRICVLAKELGGADAYANETCERGNTSCKASRERCCGCL